MQPRRVEVISSRDHWSGRSVEELEKEVLTRAKRMTTVTGQFLVVLGELNPHEAWIDQGYHSLAHWLACSAGMSPGAAREHVRVAVALTRLPLTTAAMLEGWLSYSKARALTRMAAPDTEALLLKRVRYATATQVERMCQVIRESGGTIKVGRAQRIAAMRG